MRGDGELRALSQNAVMGDCQRQRGNHFTAILLNVIAKVVEGAAGGGDIIRDNILHTRADIAFVKNFTEQALHSRLLAVKSLFLIRLWGVAYRAAL